MKRVSVFGRAVLVAVLATWFAACHAAASHPDVLRNYRFIPSHSTVEVSGGFAGIEQTYSIRGDFGLVTGYQSGVTCAAIGCPPPPEHIPFARFVDVEAWMVPDGMLPYLLSLDDTLNLSGLHGTFDPHHPNHLFFHGRDGQGQPFHLQATIHGRLLHLTGENDPGCCDFFHYKLDALAHLKPFPDFNHDDVIDAADFVLWRKTGGAQEEFSTWRADFGADVEAEISAALSAAAEPNASTAAVPEPATLPLLIFSAIALTFGPRRSRR